MAAISQKVPNLLGGISQQPDPVKLPGQVRAAENVYLDPTFGCRKRPGTEFVASLGTGIPNESTWFSIFRDNNERYAVCMYRDNTGFRVRVWDLNDGTERTVTITSAAATYFDDADYTEVVDRLDGIMEEQCLESHSEAMMWLIRSKFEDETDPNSDKAD